MAAALADLGARAGKRTLVCEMDAKGSLAATLDTTPLAFQPRRIDPGLYAMAMNTEDSLREYLRTFVKVPLVGRIGPLARTFDFVADAAPGVKEILSSASSPTRSASGTTTSSSSTPRRAGTSSPRSPPRG